MNQIKQETSALAIVSLVFGILTFICLGFLGAIPAIICGHIALSKIKRSNFLSGRGLAMSGTILGYTGGVLSIIMIVLYMSTTAIISEKFRKEIEKEAENFGADEENIINSQQN